MTALIGRLLAPEDDGVRFVSVEDGRVTAIGDASDAPPGAVGGADRWILPGLVDLQLNGAFGVDFSDPGADLPSAAAALPRTGVTAFLATVISSPPQAYAPILRNLSQPLPAGARVLGTHLEGPFLSAARPGVHDPAVLRPPELAEVRGWLQAGAVAMVTLAPELPAAADVIHELVGRGVIVSVGHSDATWAETDAAIAEGAALGTHLFNAMRPLHHREPGIVGRLLGPGVAASIIVDGVHVAPRTVALVTAIKAPDELVFVTDGLAALGEPPGTSRLGSLGIISDGVVARRGDGTIAGSVVPMAQALGRLVAAGLEPSVAARAASTTPARILGRQSDLGRIEVGRLADLVLLDADWQPEMTFVQGTIAHRATATAGAVS